MGNLKWTCESSKLLFGNVTSVVFVLIYKVPNLNKSKLICGEVTCSQEPTWLKDGLNRMHPRISFRREIGDEM